MDAQHFDTFVRALAPNATRRGLIAGVLGGLMIGRGGSPSPSPAAPVPRGLSRGR